MAESHGATLRQLKEEKTKMLNSSVTLGASDTKLGMLLECVQVYRSVEKYRPCRYR